MHINELIAKVAANDPSIEVLDLFNNGSEQAYATHFPHSIVAYHNAARVLITDNGLDAVTAALRNNTHVHTLKLLLTIGATPLHHAVGSGRKGALIACVERFVDMLERNHSLSSLTFAINMCDPLDNQSDDVIDYPYEDLCEITRPFARIFSNRVRLKEICLPSNTFALDILQIWGQIEPESKIESLDLSYSELNGYAAQFLVDKIKRYAPKLKRLNLSKNMISVEDMPAIFSTIYSNHLVELDLSDNNVILSEIFRAVVSRGLNVLGISYNPIEKIKADLQKQAAKYQHTKQELLYVFNHRHKYKNKYGITTRLPMLPEAAWVKIFKYADIRSKRFELKI